MLVSDGAPTISVTVARSAMPSEPSTCTCVRAAVAVGLTTLTTTSPVSSSRVTTW
ncbi:Uncharacterised protein [Mycobacteroides abscessus]|nr:Uncharacterised protein [Mycobacteroides abscessus]